MKATAFGFIVSVLLNSVGANAQTLTTKSSMEDFVAPIIYDVSNVSRPQSGMIVYDSSDNSFKGKSANSTGWLTLSPSSFSPLTTVSGAKTPASSSQYHSHTGNSLTLTAGTWRVWGSANFSNSGAGANYIAAGVGLAGANGADSGSSPTALSAAPGITVLSASKGDLTDYSTCGPDLCYKHSQPEIVRCSNSTCTIYVITWSEQSTSANARVTAYMTAERMN